MHLLHDIAWLFFFFLPCLNFGSGPASTSSSSTTETNTSSGASSPNATAGSQALGSGTIGVAGAGAKYLESGATDLSGAGSVSGSTLAASGGGSITIGDPEASNALAQIAETLAGNASNSGASASGGGSTSGGTAFLAPLTQDVNWSLVAMIGGVVLVVWVLFGRKKT